MTKQQNRQRKVQPLRKILRPLVGDNHRRVVVDIHQYLRDLILSNVLSPETILSQVEVATCLKVSRTPVREALRMLQEEGLISAEPNYRCRVLGFDPRELEALYVSRIANECISAAITVQNMIDEDVEKLEQLLHKLRIGEEKQNFSRWIKNHRAFHQMLFCRANPLLQLRMHVDCQRSERYVYNAMQSGLTDIFHRAAREHQEIYQACKQRNSAAVVSMLADHLARAAIDIIVKLAPDWEPTTLRNAAQLMRYGAHHLNDPQKRENGKKSGPRIQSL
jgi:DNA-binding GntR family transcriptional regulator